MFRFRSNLNRVTLDTKQMKFIAGRVWNNCSRILHSYCIEYIYRCAIKDCLQLALFRFTSLRFHLRLTDNVTNHKRNVSGASRRLLNPAFMSAILGITPASYVISFAITSVRLEFNVDTSRTVSSDISHRRHKKHPRGHRTITSEDVGICRR